MEPSARIQGNFDDRYVMREIGGVGVGILGLAYPKTPWTTSSKNIEGLEFQTPVDVARQFIPRMRDEGARLIVMLTHLGLAADKHLAEAISGIDVIVGGHSHNRMGEAHRVGKTLIVQAGARLRSGAAGLGAGQGPNHRLPPHAHSVGP